MNCQYCDDDDRKCPGRGLCHCGCGRKTTLHTHTVSHRGIRVGDPWEVDRVSGNDQIQMTNDQLTREQLSILDHTIHRASRGLYCGDSADMQSLCHLGLMEFAGRLSFVPDPYFRVTQRGREVWQEMTKSK